MKKSLHISKILVLSLLFFVSTGYRVLHNNSRHDWYKITNFVCYYGRGEIETLKTFDVAIIERDQFTKKDILKIHEGGSWIIGYISLGEQIISQIGIFCHILATIRPPSLTEI